MNDLSYLSSPEARRYTVESYDREYKARECKTCIYRLNDHDQEPCDSCDDKSEWKQDRERLNIPGSRCRTTTTGDDNKMLAGEYDTGQRGNTP